MNLSKDQLDSLMSAVALKSGVSKQQLQTELEKGTFDRLLSTLPVSESQKLVSALSDPKTQDALLNSPQAKALIKKLFG